MALSFPKDMLKRIMDLKAKIQKNVDISKLRSLKDRENMSTAVLLHGKFQEWVQTESSSRVLCGITLIRTASSSPRIHKDSMHLD